MAAAPVKGIKMLLYYKRQGESLFSDEHTHDLHKTKTSGVEEQESSTVISI